MRMYISPAGLRPALESDEDILNYYCPPTNLGRMIRTQKNVALFFEVINHKDVYLRDPNYSIEDFRNCDFIIESTNLFIQFFSDPIDDDIRLILSNIEHTSSIGLELYVHTAATSVVVAMNRRLVIDAFLTDKP